MKTSILLVVLALASTRIAPAAPPDPPAGKRWILNQKFSDEFNGTRLDSSKWFDHHPTWAGREPGIFLPSQIALKDGFMSIKGGKLKEPKVIKGRGGKSTTYTIAGGAVVSKTTDAWFGYYECRFKAAKTTMSTTFWLSSRKHYDGPKGGDKYGLELDIQECIGRVGDFKGAFFAKGMNSNSHFWYTDPQGEKHDLRAPQIKKETPTLPSEDFYTYGGWWKDESHVNFYLNDELTGEMEFYSDIKDKPFDQPMGLNMVSETYPFPWISLPTDEELADDSRNTCYYDWVRAYTLIGVDEPAPSGPFDHQKTPVFPETVAFADQTVTIGSALEAGFLVSYMANENREIHLEILDQDGAVVAQTTTPALAGFGRKFIKPELHGKPARGTEFTARVHIRPSAANDNRSAYKSASTRIQ